MEIDSPSISGTLTGALTLSGAPTSNLHAATKAYVDTAVSGVSGSGITSVNGHTGSSVVVTSGDVLPAVTSSGSVSGTKALDLSVTQSFTATVSGNVTFTFTNLISSKFNGFILELTNGGSATVTWPTSVKWPSGTAPTLKSAGVDVLVFITFDNGTTWRGVLSMADSK